MQKTGYEETSPLYRAAIWIALIGFIVWIYNAPRASVDPGLACSPDREHLVPDWCRR